jgi:hypothetical protein
MEINMDVEGQTQDYYNSYSSDNLQEEIEDLKNKLNKTDKELELLTEALKTTLIDVRSLMNDIDNPFNLIKNMGIDNLVDKAVEKVTDNVKKVKREKDTDKAFDHNAKGPEGYLIPQSTQNSDVVENKDEESVIERIERKIQNLEDKINEKNYENKISNEDEKIIEENKIPYYKESNFYELYISLITDYLFNKYGKEKSEELLFSCLRQDGVDGRVVGDLINNLKDQEKKDSAHKGRSKDLGNFVREKIFISSLLKDIASSSGCWKEQTQLLLLMALVHEVKSVNFEGSVFE